MKLCDEIMTYQLEFDLLPLPQIYFGVEKIGKLVEIIPTFGKSTLIVASESVWKNKIIKEKLERKLDDIKLTREIFFIKGEPNTEIIDKGVELAKEQKAELVLSFGGGSVIDVGKAIAGLVTNKGKIIDYMEVIGKGKKMIKEPLPHIAIPTTAGTGSEVTKNAVILSKKDKIKVSIRSPFLIPKIVIVDPQVMISQPKNVTAACGIDALTQLIEAYTSRKAQPITDSLALLGIRRAVESIIRAYEDGEDIVAREDMALAALLSGICLANAGLGAVHGFAGPIGGMYNIPHGVVCGALLEVVLQENIRSMFSQVPFHLTLAKYARLGELVSDLTFGDIREAVRNLVGFVASLTKTLKIPKLKELGLQQDDIDEIIQKAKKSSSMRYNPVELTDKQLVRILNVAGGFI